MKTLNKTKASVLISTSLFAIASMAADEAALYDLAPENSAFVRIISNTAAKPVSAKIDEKLFLSEGHCQVSNHEHVKAGQHQFTIENIEWRGELAANKSYTFVVNNDAIHVIEKDVFANPKKGQFASYNLTDKTSIAVKTKDGKKAVFPEVPGNAHVAREVNPIKIDLSIYDTETKLLETDSVRFQRGQSNSLFICGSDNQYLATWAAH